jgi:hypothetical protein
MHNDLRHIGTRPNTTYIRVACGNEDKLFPIEAQAVAAEQLLFAHLIDEVVMYEGGHTAAVHDCEISRDIYRRDSELFYPSEAYPDLEVAA